MTGQNKNMFVAGVKQTRKAIRSEAALLVLLARDADPELTEPLERMSIDQGVPVRWIGSMKELGQLCALNVGAAAAAQTA